MLLESGAENKMTDMYINNINSQYLKEQSRNRMLIILFGCIGYLTAGIVVPVFEKQEEMTYLYNKTPTRTSTPW